MNLLKAGQAAVYLVPSGSLIVHSLIHSDRRIKAYISLYNTIPYSHFIIQYSFVEKKVGARTAGSTVITADEI